MPEREPLRPSSTTIECGGLVFDAGFDSGNCARVEEQGENSFAVWTTADCAGTPHATGFRSWFHFGVQGAPVGTTLQFEVHNMNAQGHLFKHDMRPVFRVLPARPLWERIRAPVGTSGTKAEDNFVLRFRHRVEAPAGEDATIFFALCYPHAVAECQARLGHIDALFAGTLPAPSARGGVAPADAALAPAGHGANAQPSCATLVNAAAAVTAASGLPLRRPAGVYFHRELLVRSVEGRRVELLTISGTNGMIQEREVRPAPPSARPRASPPHSTCAHCRRAAAVRAQLPIPGIFPDGTERPSRFANKPVFFMSARVHPGEVPASHVLDGLLAFLLRENDPRAQRLRELYVFKLVRLHTPPLRASPPPTARALSPPRPRRCPCSTPTASTMATTAPTPSGKTSTDATSSRTPSSTRPSTPSATC